MRRLLAAAGILAIVAGAGPAAACAICLSSVSLLDGIDAADRAVLAAPSPDFAALIETGAVTDPAEEFAIPTCLQQRPDPAAKAALEQ